VGEVVAARGKCDFRRDGGMLVGSAYLAMGKGVPPAAGRLGGFCGAGKGVGVVEMEV
jgi:hypothetical protein